jgi:uncharacterized repeat protein (TIGR01451 family)
MSMASSPAVIQTASPPSATSEQAPVESLALPSTDLAVTVSAAPQPAIVGEDLTYTLTITNRGQTEATGLKVAQFLPEGLTFGEVRSVSLSNGGGYGCSSAYPEDREVTCDTTVLPGGATWTIAMTVKPAAAGTIEHHATVSALERDIHPENDSVTTKIVATTAE